MLERHGADKIDDGCLGGVIVGIEGVTLHTIGGGGAEDDAGVFAAFVLFHALERLHDAKAHTVQVDAHHALPLGKVGFNKLLANGDARVGDENVDAAEDVVHFSKGVLRALFAADVDLDRAGEAGNLLLKHVERFLVVVEDDNLRAFEHEALGGGLADAGSTAGHDHALALQLRIQRAGLKMIILL